MGTHVRLFTAHKGCEYRIQEMKFWTYIPGKLASLNRSWQSKEGTYRALGMSGIEPTPSKSECDWIPLLQCARPQSGSMLKHGIARSKCKKYLVAAKALETKKVFVKSKHLP